MNQPRWIPETALCHVSGLNDQHPPREQLAHTFQNTAGGGDIHECEEVVDRVQVELTRDFGALQQRLELRGEGHTPWRLVIEERFDPTAVTGQDEPFPARVPKRERKHPIGMFQELGSVLVVEV